MAGVGLSCGVLVLDGQDELLLCHVTGTARWDIPKGGGDAGESEIDTAIRETAEETGLRFEPDELLDLGRFPYRRGKDLHLFAALIERIDTARCVCTTHFRDARGNLRLEMDGFEWVPFAQVTGRCGKSLAALLTRTISLPSLSKRLVEARAAVHGKTGSR